MIHEMFVFCGAPECRTPIDEPTCLPESERKPCSNCGSVSRHVTASLSAEVRVTSSIEATVERGLNDTRLAVLGILVGIALAIGFGIQAGWP